ncbi:MAG: PilN domain-containing protein [Candidatus Parcubacteria bacterium]|nr:PilN domain-containing protein [Candidatus Parcubacteria bacterium]
MINLLPENEKQRIRKEYHLLVLSVWLPVIFIILIVAISSFLPSFFLSRLQYQKVLAESQTKEVITKQSQVLEMKRNAKEANTKIALLLKNSTSTESVLSLFREIVESRPGGVYITNFSFDRNAGIRPPKGKKTASPSILVQGRADNRAELLSFVDALNKKKDFSSVDLPLSNLISSTNLSYTLNIAVTSP